MKKSILLIVVSVLIFGFTARAQDSGDSSSQIDVLADRLKRYAGELLTSSYSDIKDNSSGNRKVIERAFLAQQFDASVGLFQQMLGDNRQTSDLRDAFEILKDTADRVPKSNSNESLMSNVKNTFENLERELKNRSDKVEKKENTDTTVTDLNAPTTGRAFWRGMVDNKVHLLIKGIKIQTRTMEGKSYPDGTFTFTSLLPQKEVTVGVNKMEGRGKVSVFQQPNSQNDFTAIIEVEDAGGGAKEYQLEIFWK
jgi:hypothetical protein